MGAGKSTYIIDYINQYPEQKYLVIVPTLEEIERYRNSITTLKMYAPQNKGTSKSDDLIDLLAKERCVVTTHELILRLKLSTLEVLQALNYTLVIDECLNVIKEHGLNKEDLEILLKLNYVVTNDTGYLKWNEKNEKAMAYDGQKFQTDRELCNLNSLMTYTNKSGEVQKLMWVFPVGFFRCFKDTYILTYGWEGSFNKSYFDMHGLEYNHLSLVNGELVSYDIKYELSARSRYKELINICADEKLNSIGNHTVKEKNPLCKNWYEKHNKENDILMNVLKNNTGNYFRNIIKEGSKYNMWTTFKSYRPRISEKGYKGTSKNVCFVPIGTKATNKYAHKTVLAYLVNSYAKPDFQDFLRDYGVEFNESRYALNEMLQWIWRSAIRNGQAISIYIPSIRMRDLLEKWLNGEV